MKSFSNASNALHRAFREWANQTFHFTKNITEQIVQHPQSTGAILTNVGAGIVAAAHLANEQKKNEIQTLKNDQEISLARERLSFDREIAEAQLKVSATLKKK